MNGQQALVGWMGVGLIIANIFEGPFKTAFSDLLSKDGNTHDSGGSGLPSWLDPLHGLGPLDPENPLKQGLGLGKKLLGKLDLGGGGIPKPSPPGTPKNPTTKSGPPSIGRPPVVAPAPTPTPTR